MNDETKLAGLSQDAAIVLALAETAIPFARSPEDEAERWVRLMRLNGQVGRTLQALGVGEAPLATSTPQHADHAARSRPLGENPVPAVTQAARQIATDRGAECTCTTDVLLAVCDLYGDAFEHALYVRGSSCEELMERLAANRPAATVDSTPAV
jgi:hypothetical protein